MAARFNLVIVVLIVGSAVVLSERQSRYWQDGSGDAPFAKVKFTEKVCKCPDSLNTTLNGCQNTTSGKYYEENCDYKPYWGMVFVWWAGAAFLIGAATSSGLRVCTDVWSTFVVVFRNSICGKPNQISDISSK
mmetsp:Transcript_7107/g.10597  ORF Transcript_7107/g.10597 Transcript_7107/m.10597 type:complete len:133 (+) Transcript_7107:68-466(+)